MIDRAKEAFYADRAPRARPVFRIVRQDLGALDDDRMLTTLEAIDAGLTIRKPKAGWKT